MQKIQPNDPCPCGSGKKYKKCCGIRADLKYKDVKSSDLYLDDFVAENLNTDCLYLVHALQGYLGPDGFNEFCEKADFYNKEYSDNRNGKWFDSEGHEQLKGLVLSEDKEEKGPLYTRPYCGVIPEKQGDIMSLCRDGLICKEGRQVEIFHAVLMDNLVKRFDDYLYKPSEKMAQHQYFGAFAHRGYDFLLGITLYLELQLGVHVYFEKEGLKGYFDNRFQSRLCAETIQELMGISVTDVLSEHSGLKAFVNDYYSVIDIIKEKYDPGAEVEMYRTVGAYHSSKEYEYLLKMLNMLKDKSQFDYTGYLKALAFGICVNDLNRVLAGRRFPQCDLQKYLLGLENLSAVFGEYKVENLTDLEQYYSAVFNFTDELNGLFNSFFDPDFTYNDFPEITEDEISLKDGMAKNNPARKSTSSFPVRKLRMNLFNVFNGKSFVLVYKNKDGESETIGKYPILPWISNEGMKMFHTNPFDGKARKIDLLFSENALDRQDFLNMEYQMGAKPAVNRVEEYLDPEIYYDWIRSKEYTRIKEETEVLREKCNSLKDEMDSREEELDNEYQVKIGEIISEYEAKADEIREIAEKSAIVSNYDKIKHDVDDSLSQYEKDVKDALGIDEPLLSKLNRKKKKLSNELKKQLYTSELTYQLLTDSSGENEPVDVTIAVLPLTKSIEIVLKVIYDHIPGNELEDFTTSKFADPVKGRGIYFIDKSQKKKENIEMWALTQLFNDNMLSGSWDTWWNSNLKYIDLSILAKFAGKVNLPQLKDGEHKSSFATFEASEEVNRKVLYQALNYVRDRYRNPVAHSTTLKKKDYSECRELLISGQKLFWILLAVIK